MKLLNRVLSSIGLIVVLSSPLCAYAEEFTDQKTYCEQAGGVVEELPAQFITQRGVIQGHAKLFCNFYRDDAFIPIGLETFASDKPSIAATFAKQLSNIGAHSPLWLGEYSNPADNLCKNLKGSSIGYYAIGGGFASPSLGQTDMCVFGDGSMVSAWVLVYMANHREGYDEIKAAIRAEPIDIWFPMQ